MEDFLFESGHLGAFVLVTVILGGGAAWLTGRAIALTWRPWWQVLAYSLFLTAAERFFDFALFDGPLLSPHYYVVDGAITAFLGLLGLHMTRARKMARQYGVLLRGD